MNTRGDIVHGGNREYAMSACYAHAEEAVVSKLFSEYPDVPLLGIGVYGEHDSKLLAIPCPCGNCRDVLRTEASPDLLLTAGNESQGATVMRLSEFLFDPSRTADPETTLTDPLIAESYDVALRARDRSVTAHMPEHLQSSVYGVALIDTNQQIFPGSLDTTASYDAIPPGVAAVQSFRNRPTGANTELARLRAIVIAGAEERLDPLYRDRSALTELDETLRSDDATSTPTPVLLFGTRADRQVPAELRLTDTAEWLPFPFTSSARGLTKAIQLKRAQLVTYL